MQVTMSDSMSVMVTGVGGGGHGEQIFKALRLAETAYEITGTDLSRVSSGLALADRAAIVPPATNPAYVETLLRLCDQYGVRAIFHGSEPELKVLSDHRERFAAEGILVPVNPARVINLCMDKLETMAELRRLGFSVPAYARIETVEDALAFPVLPAVLKPAIGGGGSAHLYLVQDREELVTCSKLLLSLFPAFVAQAYVGTPEDEYTVGVLCDLDGNLLNSIAVRRYIMSALSNRIKVPNRSGRAELGPTLAVSSGVSQGEIGRFPEVTQPCEEIALALGACGPINIQCRLVDGEVCVFEINPRFSGTTSLRAMVGYNEPDVLIRRHLLGEEVPAHFPYRSGVILRSLHETFVPNETAQK
jgi:carbamoyl-phosphate synthase large subunit